MPLARPEPPARKRGRVEGRIRRVHDRLWRFLAGSDGAARPGLPYDEALAPMPLLALAALVLNDRVLKQTVPSWFTGKLSDVAGLAVAPLVLTAAIDIIAWLLSRTGVAVDYTFRRWKLVASIAATGLVFTAVKLWTPAAEALTGVLAGVFGQSRIVVDPTDLLTLPALALAWWHGRRTLAHVPYGRLTWVASSRGRGAEVPAPFADAVAAGAEPSAVRDLEAAVNTWTAGGSAVPVDACLAALRRGGPMNGASV